MLPSPHRRTAPLALVGLLAALLTLVVTAAPGQAVTGCQSEKAGPLGFTCDDVTPPDTLGASGAQTAAGQVTVSATSSYGSTGDIDPVGYQCQVTGSATWGPCVFSGLAAGQYTFSIRAVDTADLALHPCVGVLCTGTEVPDYDATPATVHATVTSGGGGGSTPPPPGPGGAPETQITGGPSDRITPGQPVSLTKHPTIQLAASEAATYNCAINAKKVACHDGVNVLKGLKPGTQVFVAQAVDRDGNFDATPASITFYVPYNLTTHQGKGWKKVKAKGSYSRDYVSTTHQGAVLSLAKVKGVHELRLIAPTGPRLGKVAVRVGNGGWLTVDLKSATSKKLAVFELRRGGSGALSGALQIKALKVPAGGAVAVDAIVAR